MHQRAKRLMMLPTALLRWGGDTLREHFVHLTIGLVIGTGWVSAWCRSVEPSYRRTLFPALRQEELDAFIRERDERATGGVARSDVGMEAE